MLTIRQAQIDALSRERMANFKGRLADLLASTAPRLAPHEIEAANALTLREAQRFGLVTEADIARFGVITLRAFGRFPASRLPVPALAILMSYGVDPQRKLDRYEAWATSAAGVDGRPVDLVQ